jgi:hypothetical protein
MRPVATSDAFAFPRVSRPKTEPRSQSGSRTWPPDLAHSGLRIQRLNPFKAPVIRLFDARKAVAAQHQLALLWLAMGFSRYATGSALIGKQLSRRTSAPAAPVRTKTAFCTHVTQDAVPAFGHKGQRIFYPTLGARDVEMHAGRAILFRDGRNGASPGRPRRPSSSGLSGTSKQTRP